MAKATDDHTTSPEPTGDRGRMDAQQPETAASDFPMSDIELELGELNTIASLVGHLATSDSPIETEVLNHVEHQITARHDRLKAFWKQVWDEQRREHEAHAAALEAAKARTAPGSQAEAERLGGLWGLLAAAAEVVLERAREAMPEGTCALAGDAVALRHAVAPIDAGLPPAESGRA
jgi:hypothetical protein